MAGITVVQSKQAASNTLTLTSTPTNDNYLIAIFRTQTVKANVTPPAGWSTVANATRDASSGTHMIGVYYKKVAGDGTGVTFTDTGGSVQGLDVYEVSGLDLTTPLDAAASNASASTGTSHQPGTTGTLALADEFVITGASTGANNGGSTTITTPTITVDAGTGNRLIAGSLIVSDAARTALNPLISWLTTNNRLATIATFKSATVAKSDSDSGSGADAATLAAASTGTESGTGADDATLAATASDTETATGADDATLAASLNASNVSGAGESGTGSDSASIQNNLSASESGTGSDDGSVESETILPPNVVLPATARLLAMTDVAIRSSTIRFDLLNVALRNVGVLRPRRDIPPTIEQDTTRSIMRTLTNLVIPYEEAVDVNVFEHRVAPVWVLENGAEFPLGVFLFSKPLWHLTTRGRDVVTTMIDYGFALDQSDGTVVSYADGRNISDCLADEWRASGVPEWTVDNTGIAISGTLAWAPTVTRRQRMADLSALGGLLPPYMNNVGTGKSRAAPDPITSKATLTYGPNGTVYSDSIVESNDHLDAPNRYTVVGGSASDVPIVGVYDIPSSLPWSAARRGIVVGKTVTMAGVTDSIQAAQIAAGLAAADGAGYEFVEFDAVPDPRHDSFDLIGWDDKVWLETSWRLPLVEGSAHHHKLRRVADDDG